MGSTSRVRGRTHTPRTRQQSTDTRSDVRARMEALATRAVSAVGEGDAAVSWVAERQLSVIGGRQAAICGLGRAAVAGRCKRRLWRPVHRDIYLVGSSPPVEKATVFAAVASCAPLAAAGGETAAWLYGARDNKPQITDVVMLDGHNPGRRDRVRVHQPRIEPEPIRWRHGIPVTGPLDTLIAVAGTLDIDELEAVWALMVRNRVIGDRALREGIAAAPPRPGIAKLRNIGGARLTRSPPERELLKLIRLADIPIPQTNVRVGGKEVDMWWPDHRLVVEVDAFGTHGSPGPFERDRWTDTDFDLSGIVVRRFTRRQIRQRPYAVIARLAISLARRA